ncbi:MAG TPA: hypothetical protein HA257_08815 [Candidatus Methanoperedenaceae archaeon]|nr:hypothetical protein [Candidatus Methanoperedenaceae archaeon]
MASLEVDIFSRRITVDLHGYATGTAISVAREKIWEAYEHGFRHVRLIHGNTGHGAGGTGTIRSALLELLNSGGLGRWAMDRECENHRFRDTYMDIALRPNPVPGDADWTDMPLTDY